MRNVFFTVAVSLLLVSCGGPSSSGPAADPSKPAGASTSSDDTSSSSSTSGSTDKPVEVAGGTSTAAPTTTPPPPEAHKKPAQFVMARPPFEYTLKQAVKVDIGAAPKITVVTEKKDTGDEAAWFARNALKLPGRQPSGGRTPQDAPLPTTPAEIGADKLHHLLDYGDHVIAMYGPHFSAMRVLMLLDGNQRPKAIFDFTAFVKPPEVVPGDEQFTQGEVIWAMEKDGVLYVSTGHHTFAKSSKGKNAYLSAIDVQTGALMWQSEPLVCNAQNFVIHGGYVICAYGFSKESDFLYVISRADGKTVSKLPMSTGATYIVMKDGKLYVRGYDKEYVCDVR